MTKLSRGFVVTGLVFIAAIGSAQTATIDLTGVRIRDALNQSRNSGATTCPPSKVYAYSIDGYVVGESGLFQSLFPTPTRLADALEAFLPGSGRRLKGVIKNQTGQHPFVIANITESGSVTYGLTIDYAFTIQVQVRADNVAEFNLTGVNLEPSWFVGSLRFTSGAATITKIAPFPLGG
ncbi:MAG: hypothetical protein HONBIEJF_00065 [Fimbriimonadaceae bacterium]|nr:hypothetical protein [Fimbriimonadaceae bacterium]